LQFNLFLCHTIFYMLFYRIFIWLYPKAAWLLGFTNNKARAWVTGRKDVFPQLINAYTGKQPSTIWMHCSSLGEFEQGLPLLEELRIRYPQYRFLVSFFSPSGYEIRKHHPAIDLAVYLPMDSPGNAKRFLEIVQPSLVIFIKYEYWYYYLTETHRRHIPLILASGIFRKDQPFFRWYGGFYRKMLPLFSWFFVQNEESLNLLQSIGYTQNVVLTGDTRFDRVLAIADNFESIPVIEDFCGQKDTIVAGSTWTEDDEELDHFINTNPSLRCLVAPHDIDTERLEECLGLYKNAMLFSTYVAQHAAGEQLPPHINTLVIDNMGMLSRLYKYATICYVGGGFGEDGIHNILEAAVYSKPVVFGPVYDKYFEADELLDAGGAYSIEDALELESVLKDLLSERELLAEVSKAAGAYVRQHAGATAAIMQYIQEKRLLIT
jgi:3-deoxy-D-manno-octulosonic-acid transferase